MHLCWRAAPCHCPSPAPAPPLACPCNNRAAIIPTLRRAFTSGRLAARKARVESVDGKTLSLSDGSKIEVR